MRAEKEKQFEDLIRMEEVNFSYENKKEAYKIVILDSLRREFPLDDFGIEPYRRFEGLKVFKTSKKAVKKRFLWKTYYTFTRKKEELASVSIYPDMIAISIHHPSFLNILGGQFNKLNKFFGLNPKTIIRYPIDVVEAMNKIGAKTP